MRAEELAAASLRPAPPPQVSPSDRTIGGGGTQWSAFDDDIPASPEAHTGPVRGLAEIFDYLHRGLTIAVENIDANDDGTEVRIGFGEWQTIQAVQMLLARYGRTIAEPEHKG